MVKEFLILQTFIHINIDTLNYHILVLFWQSCSDKHCAICHFLHRLQYPLLLQLHVEALIFIKLF